MKGLLFLFADRACRYDNYARRFFSIFSAPRELPVYYIPGNHDVGLGNRRDASTLARARYKVTFGSLSRYVYLGGHSLFLVDAPALVDEDLRRERAGENRTAGLPRDLGYLRHMRAQNQGAASGCQFTTFLLDADPRVFVIQRRAFDSVYAYTSVSFARVELWPAPRERDPPCRSWARLPNAVHTRDI